MQAKIRISFHLLYRRLHSKRHIRTRVSVGYGEDVKRIDFRPVYFKHSGTACNHAIAKVAKNAALECYGIVETVSRRFTDSLSELIVFCIILLKSVSIFCGITP